MKIINQLILLSYFAFIGSQLNAEVSHGVLEKYKQNNIFVCLGIYSCINLARALNAGFTELHGIDADEVLVNHANIIFPKDINDNPFNITNYHIHHGSLKKFEEIISYINEPITIFLGNHFPDIDQIKTNNILQELEIIKSHNIKVHTILIDYIHHENMPSFGYISLVDIKRKLIDINPKYIFSFEKGGHLEKEENAILVAYLEYNELQI